jgi:hypothetical protein
MKAGNALLVKEEGIREIRAEFSLYRPYFQGLVAGQRQGKELLHLSFYVAVVRKAL